MHFYLQFSILLSLLTVGYSAGGQCIVNHSPTEKNTFPNRTFLTYNESTNIRMKDYFTGVNLTFSYTTSDSAQPYVEILKTKRNDGNYDDIAKQIFGDVQATVTDIYWDDYNVTSLNQKWGNESNVLLLVKTGSNYSLISGSIYNLHAPNEEETAQYNRVDLVYEKPEEEENYESFDCFQIARVGNLKYYVDCAVRQKDKQLEHLFYYVEMDGFPPSNSKIKVLQARLTMKLRQFYEKKGIVSATVGSSVFLLHYYNKKEAETKAAIEVYDVTNPAELQWKSYYGSDKKLFSTITCIQSLVISGSYLYISQTENFTIFKDWHSTMTLHRNYHFDQMDFKYTNLRVIPSATGFKESVLAVGSVNKANLFALLFVNQAYQGFYTIPLPPVQDKSQPLQFQIFSLSLGEDFFALSYSVTETATCYYFAIIDISSNQANDCHTLWASSKSDYVKYLRMNPTPNTDTLYIIRANNTFTNLAIFSPNLPLHFQKETTRATLIIEDYKKIQFDINVLKPEDKAISVNVDMNAALYKSIMQRGPQAILFLNSSIYGPKLQYTLTPTQNQALKYNIFTNQSISSDFTGEGEFIAARRRKVGPFQDKTFLLIEKIIDGVKFNIARPEFPTNTNISALKFKPTDAYNFKILDYFFANVYDILLLNGNKETPETLAFCKLDLFIQEPEKNKCVHTKNFVISTLKGILPKSVNIVERYNGDLAVMGIYESTVYIDIISGDNVSKIRRSFKISPSLFKQENLFTPADLQAHPEYPDSVFVTTVTGNVTYIVDYSTTFLLKEDAIASISYNAIFAHHEAASNKDVIVQPFDKNLFYIFPKLNTIEHWDLSMRKSPYYRRNLDLYSYHIDILLTKPFIKKGSAFSSTSDALYLVALDSITEKYCVLVLKPNNANSYIVNAIPIEMNLKHPQDISIDVTGTHTSTYGNLFGDILIIGVGSKYSFVEVYPTPYLSFPIRVNERLSESPSNLLNQKYTFSLKAENQWSSVLSNLVLSIFEDERSIQPKVKILSKTIEENISNATFGISDLFSGTVYNLNVSGPETSNISLTQFIIYSESDPFELSNVKSVIAMNNFTYYLTSDKVAVKNNSGSGKPPYIPILPSVTCNNIYIDLSETYGVILCKDKSEQEGFFPFYIKDLSAQTILDFIPFPSLKDLYVDGKNSLLFLLIQAKEQRNSSIIVYGLDKNSPKFITPLITMQDWLFSKTNLQLEKLDVFFHPQAKFHLLFTLDTGYGLRLINYLSNSRVADLVASFSFAELYKSFPISTNSLKFNDVTLIDYKCESDQTCNVKVMLIAENFHSLFLQFEISKQGLNIKQPKITALLVSSDFQVIDYQYSNKTVILLARNKTSFHPTLDMISFNVSDESSSLNSSDPKDQNLYKIPTWIQVLNNDLYKYVKETHSIVYPTIFINTTGSYEVIVFPNLDSKKIEYRNITNQITINWDATPSIPIQLEISNNYQQVNLPLLFEKPKRPSHFPYLQSLLGIMGVIFIILFSVNLYNRSRNKKIQYARRKQKDPLRDMLLL